jgi:peroxiredoxin
MVTIHKPAPPFTLPDLDGVLHSLEEQRGWIVLLNFWSAECSWCERTDPLLLEYLPVMGQSGGF